MIVFAAGLSAKKSVIFSKARTVSDAFNYSRSVEKLGRQFRRRTIAYGDDRTFDLVATAAFVGL